MATFIVLHASAARAKCAQAANGALSPERPVVTWASGPLEVIAAFEKPVDPDRAKTLVGQNIPYFDLTEPGKSATGKERPAGSLRIVGVKGADDGRTLLLATDPHPRRARFVLPIASSAQNPGAKPTDDPGVSYDLSGVEWGWSPAAADPADDPRSTGWWPSLDLETTRRLTRGSKPHEDCLARLAQPGRLVLSALVKLPDGAVTVRLESTGSIDEAILGDSQGEPATGTAPGELHRVELRLESKGDPLFLSFRVQTGQDGRPFQLKASYRTAGGKTETALARDQLVVPWAPFPPAATATAPLVVPDLSGGDPVRGQSLFSGENARCSQCHTFRGQGGKVGPDLTEIGRKGSAEIYRNIAAPSATIEPDFTSYTVATKDGQVAVGIVRAEGPDAIKVTDTNAKSAVILRTQISQIRPSGTSIMPVGLAATLGEQAIRDLIAFLTSQPPQRSPAEKR